MIQDRGYAHGGDVYSHPVRLDFSANVSPLGAPEEVRAAVRASAERIERYPDPYCGELRDALAALHGTGRERIVCGNGAADLIFRFASALKPKRALLPVPSFSEYEAALAAAGCRVSFFPLERADGFALPEPFPDAIGEDTGLVVLCSPNNPTGHSVPPELLLRVLDRCRETGTWLFLDECFYELTDAEKAFSLDRSLRDGDRVFLLRAFTKAYGMAGVRLGYGICPDAGLLLAMSRAGQPWDVSVTAQAAGLAALGRPDWPEAARELVRREKPRLAAALREAGCAVLGGDANYLFFSGPEGLGEKLLERGVLIRDCGNYRGLGPGYYRVAVRTETENDELIRLLREGTHA